MNVGFTVFTGDDMSAKHKPTTFALPVRMPRLKCSCREANEITHICAGCYELFCLKCYKEHRQQVLATLDYNADVNDTVFQAIYATSNQHDIVLRFNPIELRQHIYAFRDNMTSAANDSTRQALRSLRKLMDERNDKLIECIGPIKDVRTQKEAKSYVEQNWQRIIAELRAENDRIEHASNTSVRKKRVATYMGCIGNDFDGTRLTELAEEAGLNAVYQEHPTLSTGRCAILVMPDTQTRIASLGASEGFTHHFLETEENWQHIERAKVLCSE
ncbi:unnamed protein product, partial [Rotaria sp. Silwood1]